MATIHSSSTGSSNKATATASAAATTATASPSILVEFVEKRTHVSRSKARVSAVARPLSKQHSIGDELAVPRDHDDDEDRPGSARGIAAAAAASAAASASVSVADHSIHVHGGSHSASLLGFSSPASPATSTTSASTPVLSTRPRSRSVSSPKTNYDSGSESDDDDEDDDDDEERGSTGRKTDAERKKGAIPAYLRLSHPRMLQSHQHSPVKEIVESFVQQQLDMEKRWIDFRYDELVRGCGESRSLMIRRNSMAQFVREQDRHSARGSLVLDHSRRRDRRDAHRRERAVHCR